MPADTDVKEISGIVEISCKKYIVHALHELKGSCHIVAEQTELKAITLLDLLSHICQETAITQKSFRYEVCIVYVCKLETHWGRGH